MSPNPFLFLAGQSNATISQKFVIKFTVGQSNCRARKIKNNLNILSETASDKTCAGQALSIFLGDIYYEFCQRFQVCHSSFGENVIPGHENA